MAKRAAAELLREHWTNLKSRLEMPPAHECHVLVSPASAIGVLCQNGTHDLFGSRYALTYDWEEAENLRKDPDNHLLLGSRGYAKITPHSFGMAVLGLAPDGDRDEIFWELSWARRHLVDEGLILACVAADTAIDGRFMSRFLSSMDLLYVDGRYQRNGVVLVGRPVCRFRRPTAENVRLACDAAGRWWVTVLKQDGLRVPPSPGPKEWASTYIDPKKALEMEPSSPVWSAMRVSARGRRDAAQETPPLPLRQGHVALQLATGLLDGVLGAGEHRHVVKGRVVRRLGEPEEVVLEDGRHEITRLETLGIEIAALTPEGRVHTFASTEEAGEED